MAATRFLDFSTPTSYSTPNTLGGLSRTVTELPPELLPLRHYNGAGLGENIPSPEGDFAKFDCTLLEFHEFNVHEIFRIVREPVWLSNVLKKSKICRQSSEQK